MSEEAQVPEAVARFSATRGKYYTEESYMNGYNFKPGPTDVVISTAAKAGTTLTQQICHGLRSNGDMSFDEIGLVVPCLEMAYDHGYKDLHTPQLYQPQMFKTHFWYSYTPKGAGKYITVVRKPADTALSFFHFVEDWYFKKGEVSLEDFMKWLWLKEGPPKRPKDGCSTVHHIGMTVESANTHCACCAVSWYPHRFDKNVLWLHYEDTNQNRHECVRLIAEFLEIEADEDLLDLSSIEFMKKHSTKYDGHPLKYGRNEAVGLPREAGLTGNPGRVRKGESDGAKNAMPQYILDQIAVQWNEVVTAATGYETYEEFRAGINKELNRNFD